MTTPLVSIYITTKDRYLLLDRAIQSVLNQTWVNTEIIVCDDNSTDGTQDILAKYEKQFDNFYWIRNEATMGACVSRNKAIKKAKGEFITGLDDDDYFLPQRVELLMKAYDDKYAFVCSTYLRRTHERTRIVNDGIGIIRLEDVLHCNKVGNQVLTRNQRLIDVGGFDEALPSFQDYDMWVRLLNKFGNSLKIKEPLYVFDISHTSERISGSNERVKKGYELFMAKHNTLMSKGHTKSMKLLKKIIYKEPLLFLDVIKLANFGNYKSIISNLLKQY